MTVARILRDLIPGRTADTARSDRSGARRQAGFAQSVLPLVHAVSVGLAVLLAAGLLMLASLRAVEADPAIVGAPAPKPLGPADATRVDRGLVFPSPTGDSLSRCSYDALDSLGGTVDEPGHQRTDPACQRR